MQTYKGAILVFVTLGCFICGVLSSCPADVHVNGCSIPLNAPFPYKELFKPVCNRHDVCYICGNRYGWTREICDVAFKRDMEQKCTDRHNNRKRFFSSIWNGIQGATKVATEIAKWPFIRGDLNHCKHGAKIYYEAVKYFGKSYFSSSSPEWCKEECAKNAGNPHI